MGSRYSITKAGSGYVVDVEPAPPAWSLFIIGGATTMILGGVFNDSSSFLLFVFCAGFGGALIAYHLHKNREMRSPVRFEIQPGRMVVDGETIEASAIHRFVIRNHVHKEAERVGSPQSGSVAVVPIAAAAISGAGRAAGERWKAKRAAVSFRVEVESGGRARVIGYGLDETTAFGLMTDVQREVTELDPG